MPIGLVAALLAIVAFFPPLAEAQSTGRVGRATVELDGDSGSDAPAIWLTDRSAFVPNATADGHPILNVRSVCLRDRCGDVTDVTRCERPFCPADGWRAEVERRVTDQNLRWRTDHEGYTERVLALRADPEAEGLGRWLRLWSPGHAPNRAGLGFHGDEPGALTVWLAPRVAFSTDPSIDRVCVDESECARVVSRTACDAPECPGPGTRLHTDRDMAEVNPWDPDHYELERVRLDGDLRERESYRLERIMPGPELDRALLPSSEEEVAAPEGGESWPSWRQPERTTIGVEIDAAFTTGSFIGEGFWMGASAGVALQFELDPSGPAEEPADAFFFDSIGVGVRAHVLSRVDIPNSDTTVAVGGALQLTNRINESAIRLPTLLGALVPEIGALFRVDAISGAYLMWSLPLSVLLTSHLALDLRPRLLVALYDQDTGRDNEVFAGLSIGIAGVQIGTELPRGRIGSWLPF